MGIVNPPTKDWSKAYVLVVVMVGEGFGTHLKGWTIYKLAFQKIIAQSHDLAPLDVCRQRRAKLKKKLHGPYIIWYASFQDRGSRQHCNSHKFYSRYMNEVERPVRSPTDWVI